MDISDGFAVAGFGLTVGGVSLVHVPAALIVAGVLLFGGAVLLDLRPK